MRFRVDILLLLVLHLVSFQGVRSAAVFRAPGLAKAKKRLAEIMARWHNELPEAMRVLEQGFTAATQFTTRFPSPTGPGYAPRTASSACTPRSSVASGAPAPSPTEPVHSASSPRLL